MDTPGVPGEIRYPFVLQWGHALSGMDTSYSGYSIFQETWRFNGAMPFQAWIHVADPTKYAWLCVLQWGHALSGMDT